MPMPIQFGVQLVSAKRMCTYVVMPQHQSLCYATNSPPPPAFMTPPALEAYLAALCMEKEGCVDLGEKEQSPISVSDSDYIAETSTAVPTSQEKRGSIGSQPEPPLDSQRSDFLPQAALNDSCSDEKEQVEAEVQNDSEGNTMDDTVTPSEKKPTPDLDAVSVSELLSLTPSQTEAKADVSSDPVRRVCDRRARLAFKRGTAGVDMGRRVGPPKLPTALRGCRKSCAASGRV
uniref:Uncharacterized protein n=1 Tax=Chromera velia CCMP2878 TaxID=1169474 RepID=A0A0G4IEY8_9ALVE|eukprot:Cvel_2424.t1-p1 / transcript=Cvel_2424.t1 / gene=Cvel_2424 / organism=Chromera_velia_CCMP2878 / gene_product=hypothetical protein / transcript_product=hypothetical protein / location=Cvel_scaffold95:3263-4465(-) / protein_length=231 / sequence_SO=supercontig / SO=protein_coding / is_pseudo=false